MRHSVIGVVIFCAVAGLSAASQADLIPNLTRVPPDITANFVSISYDATTRWLDVNGAPVAVDFNGVAPPDFDIIDGTTLLATQTIHVKVDAAGHVVADPANSLVITGLIDRPSETFTTLLTGVPTLIGFETTAGGKLFQFEFDVTGGELAPQYGPKGGVILGAVAYGAHPFAGNFGSNFNNNGTGNADTFLVPDTVPTPEPATLLLLAVGAGVPFARRLRRRLAGGR